MDELSPTSDKIYMKSPTHSIVHKMFNSPGILKKSVNPYQNLVTKPSFRSTLKKNVPILKKRKVVKVQKYGQGYKTHSVGFNTLVKMGKAKPYTRIETPVRKVRGFLHGVDDKEEDLDQTLEEDDPLINERFRELQEDITVDEIKKIRKEEKERAKMHKKMQNIGSLFKNEDDNKSQETEESEEEKHFYMNQEHTKEDEIRRLSVLYKLPMIKTARAQKMHDKLRECQMRKDRELRRHDMHELKQQDPRKVSLNQIISVSPRNNSKEVKESKQLIDKRLGIARRKNRKKEQRNAAKKMLLEASSKKRSDDCMEQQTFLGDPDAMRQTMRGSSFYKFKNDLEEDEEDDIINFMDEIDSKKKAKTQRAIDIQQLETMLDYMHGSYLYADP